MAQKKKKTQKKKQSNNGQLSPLNTDVLFLVFDQDEIIAPHQEHIKLNILGFLKETTKMASGLEPDIQFYTVDIKPEHVENTVSLDEILAERGYIFEGVKIVVFIDNPILIVVDENKQVVPDPSLPFASFRRAMWFQGVVASKGNLTYAFYAGSPLFTYMFGQPARKIYKATYLFAFPTLLARHSYLQDFREMIELFGEDVVKETEDKEEEKKEEEAREFKVYGKSNLKA